MHRNGTTTALLAAGLLGLILAGLGVFPSSWPWVVVLGFGVVRPVASSCVRFLSRDVDERLGDLRTSRRAAEIAHVDLQKAIFRWEQRLDGTLTPDEAKEVRASHNAMVQRMAELEAQVAEAVKEQRARALAAPFSEGM